MSIQMKALYESLSQRLRPEDVAKVILDWRRADLSHGDKSSLGKAAKYAYYTSSMTRGFAGADNLAKQIKVASDLFPDVGTPDNINDPGQVFEYIEMLKAKLHKSGQSFKDDRQNYADRKRLGLPKGHRAYNKRFRLLNRMEAKYERWVKTATIKDLAEIAKKRLATRIRWDDFKQDADTACFVAYMTARLGLRSTFTWGKQERAYDRIANRLFKRLQANTANWWVVALVHPAPEVLDHLTDHQKGTLIGLWFETMKTSAEVLDAEAAKGGLDLHGLVVRRGNDSSTWNESAGAYNKCRDGWVSTLYALGLADTLDKFAPPKAMRLMAADVVYMHRGCGSGDLEPDTKVWNDLPKPWDVVLGREICTRALIETACKKQGVHGKGWIKPRPKSVASFKPTPELVHGVTVSSPDLAALLRKAGYFSGPSKGVKHDAGAVTRDYSGETLKVSSI